MESWDQAQRKKQRCCLFGIVALLGFGVGILLRRNCLPAGSSLCGFGAAFALRNERQHPKRDFDDKCKPRVITVTVPRRRSVGKRALVAFLVASKPDTAAPGHTQLIISRIMLIVSWWLAQRSLALSSLLTIPRLPHAQCPSVTAR